MPAKLRGCRMLMQASALLLALCGQNAFSLELSSDAIDEKEVVIDFRTDSVSFSNLDASPDGHTLIFDVLGDIYSLPINGGEAKPLTSGIAWDGMPRYSMDGTKIAFMSDRSGRTSLWVMDQDGTNLTQYTNGWHGPVTSPVWTSEGNLLVPVELSPLAWATVEQSSPSQQMALPFDLLPGQAELTRDGRSAVVSPVPTSPLSIGRIGVVNISSGAVTELGRTGHLPRITRDGSLLGYLARDESGLSIWVMENQVDSTPRRVYEGVSNLDDLGREPPAPGFTFSADGSEIILWARGKLTAVKTNSSHQRTIPASIRITRSIPRQPTQSTRMLNSDRFMARVVRWPNTSDHARAGVSTVLGSLYVTDKDSGKSERLTDGHELELSPAMSWAGDAVAYTTWSDGGEGSLNVISLDGRAIRNLVRDHARLINPSWSLDGSKILFTTAESPLTLRASHAVEFKWVSSDGGPAHAIGSAQLQIRPGERFYPAPRFSPRADRIYFVAGSATKGDSRYVPSLYSMRIDGSGLVTHMRLPIADEYSISPDCTEIAIIWQDSLYVASISDAPQDGSTSPDFDVASAKKIEATKPRHVSWKGREHLIWAENEVVYTADLTSGLRNIELSVEVTADRDKAHGKIAFVGGRIITMKDGQVIENGTIIVDDGRIAAVGDSIDISVPRNAKIVDVAGATIIPGLIDVHDHLQADAVRDIWVNQNYRYVATLAYGVTTTYDPAAPSSVDVFGQAEMLEAGKMLGPRLYSAGMAIVGEGGNSGAIPVSWRRINHYQDADKIVADRSRDLRGPLKEYAQPDRRQRQWLLKAARKYGASVTAEGREPTLLLTLIADGYTAVEHPMSAWPVYRDVLEFVGRSGVHYTPTLVSSIGGLESYWRSEYPPSTDPKFKRLMPPGSVPGLPGEPTKRIRDVAFPLTRTTAQFAESGTLVSTGSHGILPGMGEHFEIWSFAMGGMAPIDALRAATINSAKKLGLEASIGSLEVGKVADMVVLRGNPLEDIRNTISVEYVVKDGFLYDSASMTRIWPDRRELSPWPWQINKVRDSMQ